MSERVIHPTKTCFDDCGNFLIEQLRDHKRTDFILCHGMCLSDDGKKYSHAWLREGEEFLDFGILDGERVLYTALIQDFLENRRVIYYIEYSLVEALSCDAIAGHTISPWTKELLKACRDFDGKYPISDKQYEVIALFGKRHQIALDGWGNALHRINNLLDKK